MIGRNSSNTLPVALGAACTAVAAGAYYTAIRSQAKGIGTDTHHHIIVFLDTLSGCSRNGRLIIHPKQAPLCELEAAVCSALALPTATLFLFDTKEQLTSCSLQGQLQQHALNSSSWRGTHVIPVIASESGSLSADAASLSPITQPPSGPKPLPLVANALLATRGPYDPPFYNFWHNLFTPDKIEKWGETVTYCLPAGAEDFTALAGHADEPHVLVTHIQTCDPDVLGELLARQDDFPKEWNRAAERALTRLGKNGIFTSSTNSIDWQTVHGLFPRGFNQIKIQQAYFPIIAKKTDSFVAEWARFSPGHLVTGINNWLACMTADAVIKASCNVDMDNIARRARGEAAHPVLETFRAIGSISPATSKPWQVVGWANYLNPLYNTRAGMDARFNELKDQLQLLVEELVEQTRRGEMGDTLLSSLINDRSPSNGLYVKQSLLFGHFVNLLVAGHETTANTMGFLMYHISQNPEWEERLRQEIRDVLGGRAQLSAADIPKLVVAEACFKEALRLHPPAGQVGRDAAHDTVLQGRYLVRRGQRIQVNLVALHRNPKHWGGQFGDANSFNPERFMPGAAEAVGRHPHAYKPFGFGVRACAGMQFALWEAKTLIPMLYHNFTFKLVENFTLKPSRKESFPSPSAEGLAFHIYPAAGAPAAAATLPKHIALSSSDTAAAAATDAGVTDTAAPCTPNGTQAAPAALANPADVANVHKTPLLVLYGSNSGTCEAFAAQVVESAAAAGFKAAAATLDSLMAGAAAAAGGPQLPENGAVLVITSTYNGLPPDNAVRFAKWLPGAAAGAAAGVVYSVLGVGNSQWVTYQAFPKLVDDGLAAAGGVRLADLAVTDTEAPGFLDGVGEWWAKLQPLLLQHFQVAAPDGEHVPEAAQVPRVLLSAASPDTSPLHVRELLVRLKAYQADAAAAANGAAAATANGTAAAAGAGATAAAGTGAAVGTAGEAVFGYEALKVVASQELQAPGSARFTRHVEVELPDHITYTPGDHLEVLPRNSPALVDSALQLLGLTGEEVYNWTPKTQGAARGFNAQGAGGLGPDSRSLEPLPMRARDVLAWLMDLSAVPSRRILERLAEQCPCPPEAAKLKQMAAEEAYKAQVSGRQLTLLEVLSGYRSLLSGLDLSGLASLLPRLAPRYYSISSSPAAPRGPHRASITVALVEYTTPTGRVNQGAASHFIHNQQVGQYLAGTVRQLQSRFRLPADPSTPIILVGPGTGVAPMVGFLEEREAQQKAGVSLGPAVLFFGCRRSSQDYLYQSRLAAWRDVGVLSGLQVALSREPGQDKVYVQDLIAASGQELWQLLQGQGGHVYVCGDARHMAPDVRAAFVAIAQQAGGLSQPDSQAWLQDLREAGRYLEDVWAS